MIETPSIEKDPKCSESSVQTSSVRDVIETDSVQIERRPTKVFNEVEMFDCQEEIRKTVHERINAEQEKLDYLKPEADHEGTCQIPSADVLTALNGNEDGDASLYIELHRGRFVFDHTAGRWFVWKGHFWQEDILEEALKAVESVVEVYEQEFQRQAWLTLKAVKSDKGKQTRKAEEDKIKEISKKLIERIKQLQSLHRKKNILELAKIGTKGLGINGEEWDRKPGYLSCANGVIDLSTGTISLGQPEDFIKTVSPTEWKGINEPAPVWEKTIFEIFNGDQAVISFVQRLFGYALTGQMVEHIFLIFWGKGRNGKGTLLEVLAYVLGELAGPVEAELLLKQKTIRHSGGPTPDLMALRGKRLVWSSETEDGRSFNIGKVKWLTGGDTIVGRNMFAKHQASFQPTHTFFLLTNHKPHANPNEYAFWQRIYLIPFLLSFIDNPQEPNERKKDGSLKDKVKAEASGVLAWLVRGCLAWQKEGLNPPDTVKAATKAYKAEEDLIGQFIAEKCTLGDGYQVQAGELYKAYQKWAEENGLTAVSGVKFGREIQTRFDSYKDRNTFYKGVKLR